MTHMVPARYFESKEDANAFNKKLFIELSHSDIPAHKKIKQLLALMAREFEKIKEVIVFSPVLS